MFTLEQLNDLHDRLGKQDTVRDYVRALRSLGVRRYESYIVDGHTEFFGEDGQKILSPPAHEVLPVCDVSDAGMARHHLDLHDQRKTSYLEMSRGLANSGIEKWVVDTHAMTMVFCDKQGSELIVEEIV
jgi:uncharacterized protein YbcV (DUF1398 family)